MLRLRIYYRCLPLVFFFILFFTVGSRLFAVGLNYQPCWKQGKRNRSLPPNESLCILRKSLFSTQGNGSCCCKDSLSNRIPSVCSSLSIERRGISWTRENRDIGKISQDSQNHSNSHNFYFSPLVERSSGDTAIIRLPDAHNETNFAATHSHQIGAEFGLSYLMPERKIFFGLDAVIIDFREKNSNPDFHGLATGSYRIESNYRQILPFLGIFGISWAGELQANILTGIMYIDLKRDFDATVNRSGTLIKTDTKIKNDNFGPVIGFELSFPFSRSFSIFNRSIAGFMRGNSSLVQTTLNGSLKKVIKVPSSPYLTPVYRAEFGLKYLKESPKNFGKISIALGYNFLYLATIQKNMNFPSQESQAFGYSGFFCSISFSPG